MNVKSLLVIPLTILLSTLSNQAWAQVSDLSTPSQTAPPPDSTTEADQIESLMIEQDPELVSDQERSDRLDNEAEQINQQLSVGQRRGPQLRDLLDLPDGMIIRGSSRGGVGIGAEY